MTIALLLVGVIIAAAASNVGYCRGFRDAEKIWKTHAEEITATYKKALNKLNPNALE